MILLNGQPDDRIAINDRGVQYGDGLFETIAVLNGQLQFWQRHMERLSESCERLGLKRPDRGLLLDEARQVVAGRRQAILKIIISRGQGGRGYRPPESAHNTRIVSVHDWPAYPTDMYSQGVAVRVCHTPIGLSPALAGMKHLNRLEQVLARAEWRDSSIFEGLMLDPQHHVVEGTMSNLFFVNKTGLHTPSLAQAGVNGVMRNRVFELADRLGIRWQTGSYTVPDLEQAIELFICNSIIGIVPVRRLENCSKSVGLVSQQLIGELNQQRLDSSLHETV